MKLNAFTEISAIITDPNHTRKGYAKQLIKHCTDQIIKENRIPFLHVTHSNLKAIQLYKILGFTERKQISFWHLERNRNVSD